MKKGFHFILALVYLLSTSGVAVETHYCMGRIVDTHFFVQKNQPEPPSGMCGKAKPTKRKCCHNDLQFFKTDDVHKNPDIVAGIITIKSCNAVLPDFALITPPLSYESAAAAFCSPHPPPDISGPPLYLRYGVFRI